jgi:cell division protein FtsI/penicillin-binding protein 2
MRFHRRVGRARGAAASVSLSMIVVAIGLSSCSSTTANPTGTVNQYLAAWSHQDYRAMAALIAHPPKGFASVNRQVANALAISHASYHSNTVTSSGSNAVATITSHLDLTAFGSLTVRTRLHLSNTSGRWLVNWSPTSILPQLATGDTVVANVKWPSRADVLGAGGTPLTTESPTVSVGLEGSRITNPSALPPALEQAGVTPAQVAAAVSAAQAHPTWFIPVITLSQAAYELVKPVIYPIPGTVFEMHSARTPVTPGLSAHVVGSLGAITAQQLDTLGPPYQVGDEVGQSGIEQAYEQQLAGRPGGDIEVLSSAGTYVTTVATFNNHPGSPVQTTIDPNVQRAAETALTGVTEPAAIVAVQASTGAVLGSVSAPSTDAFDIALAGSFPPGSTFKVVTASDLIEHGLTPQSPATCPPSVTVGGATFHNFEGESISPLTLEQAFAMSCNAAFIGLSGTLPFDSFPATAAQFGIGATLHMGLAAFGGKVPTPTSDVTRAATSIGQAQVVVSPLDMAITAGAVDSGSLHLPRLVVGSADDTVPAQPLNATVVSDLQAMMAAVVDSPIGTASGAGLPAGTHGKTGTAEFGSGTPPKTDAWFIGYRGDLAFAVLVVGGGVGGQVAAPIAAKFLAAAPPVP